MNLDLLVIGHIGTETVKTPLGQATVLGGAAYYAAIAAKQSGANVGIISCVGNDYSLDSLISLDINIEGIQIFPDKNTTHFDITYLPTFENRNVDVYLGAGEFIEIKKLSSNQLAAKYAHISTNVPQKQLQILNQLRASSYEGVISVECFDQFIKNSPEIVTDILNRSDIYFANEDEYNLLSKLPIDKKIPHVTKRGALGAEYVSEDKVVRAPSPQNEMFDPTGAGDVFAGSFLGSLSRNQDINLSMINACAMASRKIQEFGVKGILQSPSRIE